MLKQIRKQLLKSSHIREAVADYRHRQDEQHYHERWEKLLKSSGAVH